MDPERSRDEKDVVGIEAVQLTEANHSLRVKWDGVSQNSPKIPIDQRLGFRGCSGTANFGPTTTKTSPQRSTSSHFKVSNAIIWSTSLQLCIPSLHWMRRRRSKRPEWIQGIFPLDECKLMGDGDQEEMFASRPPYGKAQQHSAW